MKLKTLFLLLIVTIFTSSLFARGEIYTEPVKVFKGCAKCHGSDGKNSAYGRSEPIAGQSIEDLVESINFFKDSELGGKGVILVMSKQLKHLNEEQIQNLAKYIYSLKK